MTIELIQQLHSPNPLQRRSAIISAAHSRREDVLPYLDELQQTDDIDELRRLAAQAIHYIHRANSHDALSGIPPYYRQQAEFHLLKAMKLYQQDAWADAIIQLGKALDSDPFYKYDAGVRDLAAKLTGGTPANAVEVLANPAERNPVIQQMAQQPPGSLRLPISRGLVFTILVVSALIAFIAQDGRHIFSSALNNWQVQQWTSTTYQADTIPYYAVVPTGKRPSKGWPTLIALHNKQDTAESMLAMFGDSAQSIDFLLIVPDFEDETTPYNPEGLDTLIADVEQRFDIERQGPVLFGFSHAGELASAYTQDYPYGAAGIIVSGAPYLYPPPPDNAAIPYTIIYGSEDSLLNDSSDTYVQFADVQEWGRPIKYAVIPGIGHELSVEHVVITLHVLRDIYGLRLD